MVRIEAVITIICDDVTMLCIFILFYIKIKLLNILFLPPQAMMGTSNESEANEVYVTPAKTMVSYTDVVGGGYGGERWREDKDNVEDL